MASWTDSMITTLRVAGDTSQWVGTYMTRVIASRLRGICPVCNNLQPYGHEDTLGRTPDSFFRDVRLGYQQRADLVKEAALCIPNITTTVLLESRDTDPRTGKPVRSCQYCRLICDVLDRFFLYTGILDWINDTRSGVHLEVMLMIRQGAPLVIRCINFIYEPLWRFAKVDLELYCESQEVRDTPGAPVMGLTLPRIMDTTDPSCLQWALICFEECLAQHPLCAKAGLPTTDYFVPTRLLDLGSDPADYGKIRLSERPSSPIKWAALSHCWGGGQPLKLTSSNRAEFTDHIKLSDMPQTFINAIQVCKNFAITHLWIDALCIIQDDKTDWEREAAQMGKVYSHSQLVIIASSSPNPQVPFLGRRDESWREQTVEFTTPAGVWVPIKVRKRHLLAPRLDQVPFEPPFTEDWAVLPWVGPIYKRAWCFQESFLATRSLHFTPGSLVFECKTHRRSNDSLPPYSLLHEGSLGHTVTDAEKWRLLVTACTQRQLTFGSDKLPAISGIASLMPQASRNTKYLAGLWEESLLVDLLWSVRPGGSGSSSMMVVTYSSRPDRLDRAPSWSWASVTQAVRWTEYKNFTPLVQVICAECTVTGSNPYGAVSGGQVVLRARLMPCLIRHSVKAREHHAYYQKQDGSMSREQWFFGDGMLVSVLSASSPTRVCQRYQHDMPPELARPESLDFEGASTYFLCIASTSRLEFNHIGLLVTLSRSHPGCLERIGKIVNMPRDWYDNGVEQIVTLV